MSVYFPAGRYYTSQQGEPATLNATLLKASQPASPEPLTTATDSAGSGEKLLTQPENHLPSPDGVDRSNVAVDPVGGAKKTTSETLPFSPEQYQSAVWLSRRPIPLLAITPKYPPDVEGVAGKVSLILYINEKGRVDDYKVLHADPPGIFEQASISAFSRARYAAGRIGELSVKSQFVVEITFEPGEEPRVESETR